MKIAFYINTISGGGAERVVVNLASYFSKFYDVILLTTYKNNAFEYSYDERINRYILYNGLPENENIVKKNINIIIWLRKVLIKERPDVVISFLGEANIRILLATLFMNITKIISVRNDPTVEYKGLFRKIAARFLLPLANGCVFQTEDAKRWFPKKLQNKSTIIFNPVGENFYNITRNINPFEIITCGRLQPQKNHRMLIDAIIEVHKFYPKVVLKIYGNGDLREGLAEYITQKDAHSYIMLERQTPDVPKVLSSADIFVLSSNYEGLPNALMEAMSVGLPCISTDCPCGGPHALIDDGENGLLVPVNDVEHLVSKINLLFRNEELKNEIADNARRKGLQWKGDVVCDLWKNYILHCCNLGN